jgi:hypothetical protein
MRKEQFYILMVGSKMYFATTAASMSKTDTVAAAASDDACK